MPFLDFSLFTLLQAATPPPAPTTPAETLTIVGALYAIAEAIRFGLGKLKKQETSPVAEIQALALQIKECHTELKRGDFECSKEVAAQLRTLVERLNIFLHELELRDARMGKASDANSAIIEGQTQLVTLLGDLAKEMRKSRND